MANDPLRANSIDVAERGRPKKICSDSGNEILHFTQFEALLLSPS
ncbi:hypothetical protein MCBRY_001293 [Methylocystis bryophila]